MQARTTGKEGVVGETVPDGLVKYLEAHVAGFKGPVRMEKFTGGQSNPTYKLTATSGQYVLRRQPPGKGHCSRWVNRRTQSLAPPSQTVRT